MLSIIRLYFRNGPILNENHPVKAVSLEKGAGGETGGEVLNKVILIPRVSV